jgi:hypothetical protein
LAVGSSGLLLGLALTPTALAVRTASGASRGAAGSALTLPNTNIKGSPAHFSPSKLSAKARWTSGTTCTLSVSSFTITNKKAKSKLVTFTGTGGFTPFSTTVLPKQTVGICITKGYTGTLTGKLADGKKLTVTF